MTGHLHFFRFENHSHVVDEVRCEFNFNPAPEQPSRGRGSVHTLESPNQGLATYSLLREKMRERIGGEFAP